MTQQILTSAWVVLTLIWLAVSRRRPFAPIRLSLRTITLVAFDTIVIAITLRSSSAAFTRYTLLVGSVLIAMGELFAHERLLMVQSVRLPLLQRLLSWLFHLLEPVSTFGYRALVGDWLRLIGLSFVWTSWPGMVLSIVGFPLVVHVLKDKQRPVSENEDSPKPELPIVVWPGLLGFFNLAVIVALPAILLALLTRDVTIFGGTESQALSVIATLLQAEATIGSLLIGLLFLLVQLTTAAYSMRLARLLSERWTFRVMLLLAAISIAAKVWLMTNISHLAGIPPTGGPSLLVDWTLLCTVLALLGYWVFARDAVSMFSPEQITQNALNQFSAEWMNIVREVWSSRTRSRSEYIARDPLVLVERILVSALDRGDINSFHTSLLIFRDHVSSIQGRNDGVVMDAYLTDRFASVVRMAADRRSDTTLELMCRIGGELTHPSIESIRAAEMTLLDEPPGSKFLRLIVEEAISHSLPSSALAAMHQIGDCATTAFKALPSFSELWLINSENTSREMPDAEREELWRGDERLDNYVVGYLSYFGEVGTNALKGRMPSVSRAATRQITQQILNIVPNISEERYQRHLLYYGLTALFAVVATACNEQVIEGVDIGLISFGLKGAMKPYAAVWFEQVFSGTIRRMAKAGILDTRTVIDVAVAAVNMAPNNPQIAVPIIVSFGDAGAAISRLGASPQYEHLTLVHNELVQRIDQIEQAATQSGLRSDVRLAAQRARHKAAKRPWWQIFG